MPLIFCLKRDGAEKMEGHGSLINIDKQLLEERIPIRIASLKEVMSMLKNTIDILAFKKVN